MAGLNSAVASHAKAPRIARAARGVETSVELAGSGALYLAFLAVLAIEYGNLSALLPPLKVIRASTIIGWVVTASVISKVGARALTEFRQSRWLLLLVLWTGASVLWAIVRSYVPANFRYMCDYFGLFIGTLYLIDRPARIKTLAIVMSLVILLLVALNLDKLNADVRYGSFDAPYFMGDGNDFAWGLVSLLLFPLYLARSRSGIWRLLGLGAISAGLLGVIGTQSRGATLAVLAALAFHAFVFSKNRTRDFVLASILLIGAFTMVPSGYAQRMQTLENYSEDTSAQGRLRAWGSALKMAVDFPLGVGAGNFNSAYGRYYRPDGLDGWAANRWISAHSVYFKVLGEYGVVGLVALLAIVLGNIADSVRAVWRMRAAPDRYPVTEQWAAALGLGMVGYSVAGAFLGGISYPHLFLLTGLMLGCRRMLDAADRAVPQQEGFVAAPHRGHRPHPIVAATFRPVLGRSALSALRRPTGARR